MIFVRKKKHERLQENYLELRRSQLDLLSTLRKKNKDYDDLQEYARELENTNQGSFDMNVLFSAIVDYHNIFNRMAYSDPVIVRENVIRVFEKYGVKRPNE